MKIAAIGEGKLFWAANHHGHYELKCGGDTLVTAWHLSQLGFSCDYVTALGDDPFSQEMIRLWQKEGIGTQHVVSCPGRLSSIGMQYDGDAHSSHYAWTHPSPDHELWDLPEMEKIQEALVNFDHLYLTGHALTLYPPQGRFLLFCMLEEARRRGAQVVFHNNMPASVWSSLEQASAVLEHAYARAHLIFLNWHREKENYRIQDLKTYIEHLLEMGTQEIVIKLNSNEYCVYTQTEHISLTIPADSTDRILPFTESVFNAGYLVSRWKEETIEEAIQAGHLLTNRTDS